MERIYEEKKRLGNFLIEKKISKKWKISPWQEKWRKVDLQYCT